MFVFRVNLEQWRFTQKNSTFNGTYSENSQGSGWQDSIQPILDSILTTDSTVIIYLCLVIGTVIMAVTRSVAFFRYCVSASIKLHNLMFGKIVYTPMRFFNVNPPGRILNRFSKDIGAVDETLPLLMLDTLEVSPLLKL